MNWRERQALPAPRARWFFASVVPRLVDADTGAPIEGMPARDQKWKLEWPKHGEGLTYRKYPAGISRRAWRDLLTEFPIVDDPATA